MYIISLGIELGYDPTVYTTSEGEGMVKLNIFVLSHPVTGTPRPFTLSVTTQDGTAGIYVNQLERHFNMCQSITAVSPDDYGGVIGQSIQFNIGDTNQTHTIIITQDRICEKEYFLSNILLVSGVQPIEVNPHQARVFINDTQKDPLTGQSCGKINI